MEKSLINKKLNISKKSMLKKLTNEYIGRTFSTLCGIFMIVITFLIIFFIFSKGINILKRWIFFKKFYIFI